ncbi:MAG: hypothetical protein JO224_12125 [Pelomonas sp.]|nr:hypothetical protein [Roseateles sp.]
MQRYALALGLLALLPAAAEAQGTVYRCPGPPVLYTDGLSAKEAQEKGCRTIEGTPITIVQSARPARPGSGADRGSSGEGRVDPNQQRQRDDDRHRVLQDELAQAQARLAQAQSDYDSGAAQRLGDEARNYQKYLDRVADLKANVTRQQADVDAIKREIAKLP